MAATISPHHPMNDYYPSENRGFEGHHRRRDDDPAWCSRCGRFFHFSNECMFDTDLRGKVLPSDLFCTSCGKYGHTSADCKSQRPRCCYRCGRYGHEYRQCQAMWTINNVRINDIRVCRTCGEFHGPKDCHVQRSNLVSLQQVTKYTEQRYTQKTAKSRSPSSSSSSSSSSSLESKKNTAEESKKRKAEEEDFIPRRRA